MTEPDTVAIVGLGLIGGSLARDLSASGSRVLGWDRDPDTLRAALGSGSVHAALGLELEGAEDADVLVVAVPVSAATAVLAAALPHLGRVQLITDVGSTKRSIRDAAEALGVGARFVGSHPLAGDHRSGWEASRTGLFREARVFLCLGPSTSGEAARLAGELWSRLGAHPEIVDAAEHDRRLAWSSHLPQSASSALGLTLASAGIARGDLGSGGRDATRLAGSSPELWTDIALDNAAELSLAVDSLGRQLQRLGTALAAGDREQVHRFFAEANRWSAETPERANHD